MFKYGRRGVQVIPELAFKCCRNMHMVPQNEYYVFVNPLNMKNSRTIPYQEFTGECDWINGDDMIWFPPYVYPCILKPSDIAVMTKHKYKYSDIRGYPLLATTKKGAKEIWEIYQAVVEHYGLETLSDTTINLYD